MSVVSINDVSPASAITLTPQPHFFGSRAPTFMTPSVGGAILETMEISAGFDDPLVLRRVPTAKLDAEGHPVISSLSPIAEDYELEEEVRKHPTIWNQFKLLFRSKIYIWTVFTLCALLYVVTGIQYWSTKYFIAAKHANENYVRIVFSAVAASGPTLGVFGGAFLVDRLGGYRTAKGMFRSLLFCLLSGFCATVAGVIASFLDPFPAIIAMMWFLLFFGGAMLPPATGILIAAVDPSVRPFASSFSMFAYNIGGYALGTFLPGPFMTAFGLEVGMKLIFFWSFFGVFGMSFALFFAWKDSIRPVEVTPAELATLCSMGRSYTQGSTMQATNSSERSTTPTTVTTTTTNPSVHEEPFKSQKSRPS